MVHTVKRLLSNRQYRKATVATVALSCFLSGLVVASNLPGAAFSEARPHGTSPQTTIAAQAMPGSFAELAE